MLVELRNTALRVIEAVKRFAPETETDIHSHRGEWISKKLKKHNQDISTASSNYKTSHRKKTKIFTKSTKYCDIRNR